MMPRRNRVSEQAQALRALADELDAGKRELSPSMAKALDRELAGAEPEESELSLQEWEQAWGEEIGRRLGDHRAGKAEVHKFDDVIAGIRAELLGADRR